MFLRARTTRDASGAISKSLLPLLVHYEILRIPVQSRSLRTCQQMSHRLLYHVSRIFQRYYHFLCIIDDYIVTGGSGNAVVMLKQRVPASRLFNFILVISLRQMLVSSGPSYRRNYLGRSQSSQQHAVQSFVERSVGRHDAIEQYRRKKKKI